MDRDSQLVEETPIDDDVPASVRPPQSYPKWPWVLAAFLMAVGIGIAVAWPITVPYYTLSPGPVYDTSDFIEVEDGTISDQGELFFLTVSLKEANIFEYAAGRLDERVTVREREVIRPPDVSPEDLRRESLDAMTQSKQDAIYVALTTLGYEVTFIGTGALVIETVPDSAADGVLLPNDIIIEMDGQAVAFRNDVIDQLSGLGIGDEVSFVVDRPIEDSDDEFDSKDIELELGPHVDDPSRPMVGVLIGNNEPIVEFPVNVEIDSQNIGGPSAGLMFTLQIMDQLTDGEITKGYRIAGTGTIRRDGTVGPIGGVRQKVFGAIDAGAAAVLIPADNFDEALAAAGDDIKLVRVETIDDAIAFLESL
ncbi:MAG: S16 family serine protease [Actinomycetota bacterium]